MAFKNEPFTDFSNPAQATAQQEALKALDLTIRSEELYAAPIVEGSELWGEETYVRTDPSNTSVTLGKVRFAVPEHVEAALRSLTEKPSKWTSLSFADRAAVLRKAASLMRSRAAEFRSLQIREAGKSWAEADVEFAECIDFCEYYAEHALALQEFKTQDVPGEDNRCGYRPRGVAVVIAPWNFPLAIACGMTVAALVTGNRTILKPSEQTSIIAFQLAHLLIEAGVPTDAFAFLPGRGESVGRTLVTDPRTDMIVFTGSKPVGLEIIREAAIVRPGQRNIKRVVAEMGGKNAIIVDEDAPLEDAVKGVVASAFGFAGQKCSACSRIIAVGSMYEPLLEGLRTVVAELHVGPSSDPAYSYGPVIDEETALRLQGTLADALKTEKLLVAGTAPKGGNFVAPHVFRDVARTSPLWTQELFGPVVAATKAKNFDEALMLANDSEYALTGGLFSRTPKHIERVKREFNVGNLYINRKITGAIVERQPFGGARMSGIGSKAGGKDYLLQFVEPYTWTENTSRLGS